ncbi:MAG: hypothetical protein KME23_03870 [Goleter apudmare HA4340-LM2]|jgi:hypothetical protein|nr:hypothetical protein [Goleter apudmare HA4340-LM2]
MTKARAIKAPQPTNQGFFRFGEGIVYFGANYIFSPDSACGSADSGAC